MKEPGSKNPNLTYDTKKFIDAVAAQGGQPLYKLSYEDARKVLLGAQSNANYNIDCDVQDIEIPASTYGNVSLRIVRPKNTREKLPIVMYYHGGGWVMGNKKTHDRLIKEIAVGAKVAVVFVDYTPAPDAQYPVQIEQDYAAMEYMVSNAEKFGLLPSKLAVAGDSVGGNMAAVMALKSKANKGPKIKFQVLIYPVTDAGMNTKSYKDFADGPWLTKKAMDYFWDAYLPDKKLRKGIFISPLQAEIDELKNLPPAFVITDENDVLRDEGEEYASKLSQAGIDVSAVRYNGTVHDFVMLNGLAKTTPAISATRQIIDELKKRLYD